MAITPPCQTSPTPTPPEPTTRHWQQHLQQHTSPSAVRPARPAAPHRRSARPFRACQPASRRALPACSSTPKAAAKSSASRSGPRSAHHCSPRPTCAATTSNTPCTGWPGWRLPPHLTHRPLRQRIRRWFSQPSTRPRPTRLAVAGDARHHRSKKSLVTVSHTGSSMAAPNVSLRRLLDWPRTERAWPGWVFCKIYRYMAFN